MSGYVWRQKPAPATQPARPYTQIRCGTYSGYRNHYTNHETPCAPCRRAGTAYRREYRARMKRDTAATAPAGTRRLLEAVADAYNKPRTTVPKH